MNKALIVSSSEKDAMIINQLLVNEGFSRIITSSCGSEARRLIRTAPDISLAAVVSPLSDEFGQELSLMLSGEYQTGVILICENDISEDIAENVFASGICVVSRPISSNDFIEAVRLAAAQFEEHTGMKKESSEVLSKIEEIRLINRAKATLMKYLKFTEPQAHRYIEKQAMNKRQSRKETALKILADYDAK